MEVRKTLPDVPIEFDRESLGQVRHAIQLALDRQDYWSAAALAQGVPLSPVWNDKPNKCEYARLLSLCANTWANQAQYMRAQKCSRLAIRLYMECGYANELFAEIQALSGILNMADQVTDAYWVNTYGF